MAEIKVERHFLGFKFLVGTACLFIIIAGLKAAQTILVPIMFALFLAILAIAPMRWLCGKGVPSAISLLLVILLVVGTFFLFGALLLSSFSHLASELPRYEGRLVETWERLNSTFEDYGVVLSKESLLNGNLDVRAALNLIGRSFQRLLAASSAGVLILIITIFMLVEAADFQTKIQSAFGGAVPLDRFERIIADVQRYLGVKTVTSGITGVLVGIFTYAIGLDFFVFWGLLAFLFNYVPIVGSVIAAIPPIIMALATDGGDTAGIAAIGYLVINNGVSHFLEPVMMGRQLGLSPLVIIMSLAFWGWLWGAPGMLICVPLTMILKILLEHSHDLRFVAVLLDIKPGELKEQLDTIEGTIP